MPLRYASATMLIFVAIAAAMFIDAAALRFRHDTLRF